MKIAVVTGLFAKRNVKVYACHVCKGNYNVQICGCTYVRMEMYICTKFPAGY